MIELAKCFQSTEVEGNWSQQTLRDCSALSDATFMDLAPAAPPRLPSLRGPRHMHFAPQRRWRVSSFDMQSPPTFEQTTGQDSSLTELHSCKVNRILMKEEPNPTWQAFHYLLRCRYFKVLFVVSAIRAKHNRCCVHTWLLLSVHHNSLSRSMMTKIFQTREETINRKSRTN